ncbi:hypothetical protein SGGMMB4_00606 [Sodalis glossinidius str. 'morsitans']|uniref:Uncharacterized protein n=1 Tax=Sodalis glossinidius (strain morsitans) TaxID=343509 RepID=A0A193QFG0_SODGM|nr:hypothetical protein SGGMMB4_00606 [Sodalis glossinidius str. 'morsitans']
MLPWLSTFGPAAFDMLAYCTLSGVSPVQSPDEHRARAVILQHGQSL